MTSLIFPKRALLSVSNKDGLIPFARGLAQAGIELFSTGGTLAALKKHEIKAKSVSELSSFPEIMKGRVKTLHPNILGGVLGCRSRDEKDAQHHNIQWIDLVVCNLYPFEAVSQDPKATEMDVVENIDIGGPTMLRAAAKNFNWVTTLTSPLDYDMILEKLNTLGGIDYETRKQLSLKAFQRTAEYDLAICEHFNNTPFPEQLGLSFKKHLEPRYGENPHQKASVYSAKTKGLSILENAPHQGKEMSFNNYVDADAALSAVSAFDSNACVIVKHANPCGISLGESLLNAYQHALSADPKSAFGGVVAFNGEIDEALALELSKHFFEIIIATDLSDSAKETLKKKKNLRVLTVDLTKPKAPLHYKFINGGLLVQETDDFLISPDSLSVMNGEPLVQSQIKSIDFAWRAIKSIKSNAILISQGEQSLGLSGGQVSRIDATTLALEKAGARAKGAMLSSDAFFPFRDCIDLAAKAGIKTIVQPGGSKNDNEVIQACQEHGMQLIFTGTRAFFH